MRVCPPVCEWFRGCPNQALIYYAFSDKWLCCCCIGYTRIGIPLCAEDGWRRGTCVDTEGQNWFCDSHANRCDAIIERTPGRCTGNPHRCMRVGTLYQDNYDGQYFCIGHMPDYQGPLRSEPANPPQRPTLPPIGRSMVSQISIPTPNLSDIQSRTSIPLPPSHASYQSRTVTTRRRQALGTNRSQDVSASNVLVPHATLPRVVSRHSNRTPSIATQPQGLVARIASAISSLSAILLSSENDLPLSLTGIVPTDPDTPAVAPAAPHSTFRVDLNVFSTVVDTECCICLEPQRSMRRLITCSHMFCEECLSKQVNGPYARAHDCPLCRKNIFEGTEWETY